MRRKIFVVPKNMFPLKNILPGHPILWVDKLLNMRMLSVVPNKKAKGGQNYIWMNCRGNYQWSKSNDFKKLVGDAIKTKDSTVYFFDNHKEMYQFIARHEGD